MIEPHRMARQAADNLAQTGGPRQLTVEQRHKLTLCAQMPDPQISAVGFHQSVEHAPGHVLQKPMENAILVAHGLGPQLASGSFPKRPRPSGINAVLLSTKTQPDSRGPSWGIDRATVPRKMPIAVAKNK